MKDVYTQYIKQHVTTTYGTCANETQAMADAFPELQRVRGHYHCPIWGQRTHWWLVDPDGEIVDPTRAQFPSRGIGSYEPWQEGAEEPTGRCLNCGEETYGGENFCHARCLQVFMADL